MEEVLNSKQTKKTMKMKSCFKAGLRNLKTVKV